MKRLNLKNLTTVLGCLILTTSLFAGSGKGREKRFEKFAEKLSLTTEQMDKLKTHREEAKPQRKLLKDQERSLKKQMKQGFSNNLAEAELRAIHNQINEVKSKMGDMKFDKMLFLHSVLTSEQKAKFSEMKHERGGKHKRKCDKKDSREEDLDS